ncbi:ArsR/SmtB family transcription factor [Virgifigura deserti]|uniref:ArsR/SmtB family transcription factor n=1 Tax=Virgifigura deserti TaxID=2268457 RepID=UPI003CCB9E3E
MGSRPYALDDHETMRLLAGLRAAAEPTRLRLLALCAAGELTVGELAQVLGQSQPRVSRHLKLLCDAGLLERFPEGSFVFHRLADTGPNAALAERLDALIPRGDSTFRLDRNRLVAIQRAREQTAAAYFRDNAARWDELRSLYVDEAEVEEALLALLPLNSADDLLDIGTGTGRMLELFGPRVARAIGIDQSREMLAIARSRLERARLANCRVRRTDMYNLPWPGPSFDAVTIHRVLHFAEDPSRAIAEAARVLRPGGRLVVVDFAPHALEALRTEHAHRRLGFADEEVSGWCRDAGLQVHPTRHLPGSRLTISIWQAARPAEHGSGKRRPAQATGEHDHPQVSQEVGV